MIDKNNIYLIGPMGSGKTVVGRQLAKELSMEFLDSDSEIETSTGVDISYIFEKEGEKSFRNRERECIKLLTQREGIVLATGGGSIMDEANRRRLSQNGTIVYLKTSIESQLERTQNTKNRPLLMEGNAQETLVRLAAIRESEYEAISTFTVDTGGRQVRAVVITIIKALKNRGFEALKN